MKNKLLIGASMLALIFLGACGDGNPNEEGTSNQSNAEVNAAESKTADDKGLGKFTNVELSHPLDQKMIDAGKLIYDVKCGSCHRLSKEKLVGPGWKGVTSRRKPEWIMNFATNAEEMLTKDATAMALLEECLIRMPNQNLSDTDARNILEFMRNNDGDK